MRTERNKDGTYSCWMSRSEYQEVPRQASSFEREIALRLMGDCGLRVAEVPDVHPSHISRAKDGKHHMLEVVSGKDTTGEYSDGKQCETWLPVELERQIHRYIREEGIDEDEPLIQKSKKTLQNWVEWSAEAAAQQTGDSDYERISSHDLRRCWATTCSSSTASTPAS